MSDETDAAGASPSQRERKKYKPQAKTRWYFKLLGLLLVALAGWIAYRTFVQGKKFDLNSEKGQQELLGDLQKDATAAGKVVVEKAKVLGDWAMEDLGKMIKGKPPETDEEAAALVKESKEEMAANQKAAEATKQAVAAKTDSASAAPAKPAGAYGQAQAEYSEGAKYYAMTNPLKDSSSDIQKNIRLAAPHFSKCLDLCEKARGEGNGGPGLDDLEQKAAKRLYDCNKRMELH
ncbi:MAG: hypothetical protein L6R28_04950 [Planctomycetes bacterium]|nr:hypothetical protein [Planctomycetota bacterium]